MRNGPGHAERKSLPRRLLLLLTARSYRSRAFIEAAGRLGIEVVRAYDMHRQLAEHYDYPLGLDYRRADEAAAAIAAFAREKPLGAVMAVDDDGTMVAAAASRLLGLPHNDPEAAVAARDKHVMRSRLARHGVQAPPSARYLLGAEGGSEAMTDLAANARYPCVLKPLSLSGSRGVIRADNPDQFVQAAARLGRLLARVYSSTEAMSFLVEDYVPGTEVALEGIMDDGVLHVLALFDKPDPLEGPFFEETIYVTPSRLPDEVQDQIEDAAAEAAVALGLRQGAIHAELRVNEEGPWLIEVAGRSIGGLCGETLRFGSDISLEEMILRQAFGLEFAGIKREQAARGVMMIPIPEPGLLRGVYGCEMAKAVPNVEGVEITARINYSLTPLPEGDSYLGFIFARAATPQEVEASLRKAHGLLRFDVDPAIPLLPI